MPSKVTVLLVLMVAGLGLDALTNMERISEGAVIFGLAIRVALIVGVLKGSEGVRNLLMIGAFIGLCLSGMALVAGLGLSVGGTLVIAAGSFGVIANAYMLYVLNDVEVQEWMLKRSMGGALDADDF